MQVTDVKGPAHDTVATCARPSGAGRGWGEKRAGHRPGVGGRPWRARVRPSCTVTFCKGTPKSLRILCPADFPGPRKGIFIKGGGLGVARLAVANSIYTRTHGRNCCHRYCCPGTGLAS